SWLTGEPAAIYIAELEAENSKELKEKLKAFNSAMQKKNIGYGHMEIVDPKTIQAVWELRKAGLGLLLSKPTYSRAVAFIEDIAVAHSELFSFMQEFLLCLKRFNKEVSIYGHIGAGCVHVRPYFDLRQSDEKQQMLKMMNEV